MKRSEKLIIGQQCVVRTPEVQDVLAQVHSYETDSEGLLEFITVRDLVGGALRRLVPEKVSLVALQLSPEEGYFNVPGVNTGTHEKAFFSGVDFSIPYERPEPPVIVNNLTDEIRDLLKKQPAGEVKFVSDREIKTTAFHSWGNDPEIEIVGDLMEILQTGEPLRQIAWENGLTCYVNRECVAEDLINTVNFVKQFIDPPLDISVDPEKLLFPEIQPEADITCISRYDALLRFAISFSLEQLYSAQPKSPLLQVALTLIAEQHKLHKAQGNPFKMPLKIWVELNNRNLLD